MAREFNVQASLTVNSGKVKFRNKSSSFSADQGDIAPSAPTPMGPSPGAVNVSASGTDIDLSQFDTPGFCFIENQHPTVSFEYGVYDPETLVFYPFGELKPGEGVPFRFSRNFGQEYSGTGTTAATNRLRCKGIDGASIAGVFAFER